MFDTGPGSYVRYLQTGRPLTDLTHIVYSHFHHEHCADFAPFTLVRRDQGGGRADELHVIGPRHVHECVDKQLGAEGAFAPDQIARTQHPSSLGYYKARGGEGDRRVIAPHAAELRSGEVFEANGWSLRTVEVPHVQPYLGCPGFRVDAQGQSFCYSGDASLSRAFMRLATVCDVHVHMCHRISGTGLSESVKMTSAAHMGVATFVAEANVRTCVLSHISEQMDVPGIPERLLREIGRVYDGSLIWGRDLMTSDFDDPAPKPLI